METPICVAWTHMFCSARQANDKASSSHVLVLVDSKARAVTRVARTCVAARDVGMQRGFKR